MYVQNKKYGNFVSISRFITGKCAAQKKIKFFAVLVYDMFTSYGHINKLK